MPTPEPHDGQSCPPKRDARDPPAVPRSESLEAELAALEAILPDSALPTAGSSPQLPRHNDPSSEDHHA